MIKINILAVTALAATLLLGAQSAQAHCDTIDGPVATAAQRALETGNVNLALAYVPAVAESEMKAAFARSVTVRSLGPEARALADLAFIETTVRLHRLGEGAPYSGLKPAGTDFGPAIPAAERAIESGDLAPVKAVLGEEIEHGLHARFAHAREAQKAAKEPQRPEDVPAARQRVTAELAFVTYVEGVRQAVHGAAGHEHKE
jgi:hypothetical protein